MDNTMKVRYAGFWVRLASMIIDALIVAFLSLAIILIFAIPISLLKDGSLSVIANFLMVILILLIIIFIFGYTPYFLTRPQSTTPGKQALGLIVVDKDNKYPISLSSAFMREILGRHIIDELTLGLGNLLIVIDPKKQSLHDKIGGTYVIYRDSLINGIANQNRKITSGNGA